jgi:hypothetical protein
MLQVVMCILSKNKEPIHSSDRYYLPKMYMIGCKTLEWSGYIEYWHCAIFFMGWTTFGRESQNINIFECVRLQPMSWTTNLVSKVTKHSHEVL